MAISRMQQPREMYQDGSIMPRLDQLGSGVSSAEQTLQGITQRLESAESSLGNGEGSLQPLQTADGLGAYPNLTSEYNNPVPMYQRPGNIPGTNIPFSTFRAPDKEEELKAVDFRRDNTGMAPGNIDMLNVTKPQIPMALQSPLGNAMRNMAANGGSMNVVPREQYGLGSFIKKAIKGVKKIVKSPIGKAALLGIGAFGLPGGALGMKGFLPQAFKTGASQFLFGGGTKFAPALSFKGAATTNPGIFGMAKNFLGSNTGKFLTGGALTGILTGAGMGAQEMQEIKRDPEKLKIYLRDYISKTNPDFTDAQVEEQVNINVSEYMAKGGRVGFANGKNMKMASMDENERELMRLVEEFMERGFSQQEAIEEAKDTLERKSIAIGGRVGLMGGAMPTGIMRANKAGTIERDYRETGGFVPVGIKEKADDVPAMLSKNEFVMTADAVRGIGDGNIEKGAQRLYDQMKTAEKRVV